MGTDERCFHRPPDLVVHQFLTGLCRLTAMKVMPFMERHDARMLLAGTDALGFRIPPNGCGSLGAPVGTLDGCGSCFEPARTNERCYCHPPNLEMSCQLMVVSGQSPVAMSHAYVVGTNELQFCRPPDPELNALQAWNMTGFDLAGMEVQGFWAPPDG